LIGFLAGAPVASLAARLVAVLSGAVPDLAGRLAAAADCGLFQFVGLFLVFKLQEVSYIQKRIALQAQVDKGRLHTRQNAGDAAVIN
jgi:hypothetical protein